MELSSLKSTFTKPIRIMLIFFLVTLSGLCIVNNFRLEKRVTQTNTTLNDFNDKFSGKWMVMLGRALIFDEINPLYNYTNFSATKMYILSWMCNSPINNLLLKQMDSNNILEGLLKNNVYLVVHEDDRGTVEALQKFYFKHANKSIDISSTLKVGPHLLVYKLYENKS